MTTDIPHTCQYKYNQKNKTNESRIKYPIKRNELEMIRNDENCHRWFLLNDIIMGRLIKKLEDLHKTKPEHLNFIYNNKNNHILIFSNVVKFLMKRYQLYGRNIFKCNKGCKLIEQIHKIKELLLCVHFINSDKYLQDKLKELFINSDKFIDIITKDLEQSDD